MSTCIVTISPPTPNGDLHLGHLSGPFLAADVFTRLQKLNGRDTLLLCYSDDHQSYLARKARELGRDVQELAATNADIISETLALADISVDHFMRSWQNPTFKEAIEYYVGLARERGILKVDQSIAPYCNRCHEYGFEAFARGECEHCGAKSDASQCENCAKAPDAQEMSNLCCILCGDPVSWRAVPRQFLSLHQEFAPLEHHYAERQLQPRLRRYIDEVLAQESLDWPIDRPGEYGIDIVDSQDQNLRIHTWFSGLAGYRATLQEFLSSTYQDERFSEYWNGNTAELVHFFGFDCSFSHAIVYPLLVNLDPAFHAHQYHKTNAFLKLSGEDFSTSRGHAVWIRDVVSTTGSADPIRYFIALRAPTDEVRNYEHQAFEMWWQQDYSERVELLNVLLNLNTTGAEISSSLLDARLLEIRKTWRSLIEPQHFHLANFASCVEDCWQTIIQTLEFSNVADNITRVAIYLVMASPLHPQLSRSLCERYQLDEYRIVSWLMSNDSCERLWADLRQQMEDMQYSQLEQAC